MRSSTPLRVGGLALAGIVIASVAVISASGGDTSVADRIALASVRRGTVTSYVSAAGNTVDTGVRDLAFGAEGTVEKVYVKVGEKVRRGKVLARVDDTIARENYAAAKAALAAAQETLDDVKNGTATGGGVSGGGTGTGAAAPGAGGAGAGTSGGGTGAGGAGGAGTSGATGSGAGPGNAGGSGSGGPVVCPTSSARPTAQPSGRTSGQPSPRPTAQPSGQPTSRPSSRPTGRTGDKKTTAASVALVAYRGGDHGGDHGGPKPEPSPVPAHTPRPHAKPSATHRPAPADGGAATPNPGVSVSILPTAPAQQPSAKPIPSPSGSSSTCAPGRGGQGQGSQEQGAQGRSRQGQGGGTQGRAGFGGGQSAPGGQAGQGGGARLTEAQAEAQVSQATTELAEAKKALAGVRIKAPADGTILSIAGTTGSRYTSGAFITLGDLDALQVQAMFTESDLRFLKAGQAATVTLSTQPGREYAGTVAHIDPTATTSNRLVRYGVTIDLANRPARPLLGQSATVRVTTGEAADALYVPSQAVRLQDDGTAVVTVTNDGTQTRRTVKVGVRGDSHAEITDGLAEGDQVVLPGASTAFPDEGFPTAR
ncbi:efflux RND transporter periplasmic adaptor subunit [Microbispora sp. H13382]|uniref:efflux RND transporter periplasmic adaptor subunit n=1 Tax=Microbispora sp. H13382 TaxID=2729112 RepID=UPI0015FFA86B|nr:efflux RND transporter periplasmic adaptor subunit [Microbispora sp. H13382]